MKIPSAWKLAASAGEKKVEARIDMSADVAGKGKCPECKQQMEVVEASGSLMWACAKDRITIPLPNDHQQNQTQEA